MPDFPRGLPSDPDHPGGRWSRHPAIALLVAETEWETFESSQAAVEQKLGSWVLEDDPELGKPRVVDGGVGRGAEGWVPVVEWVALSGASGLIGGAASAGVAALISRLKREREVRRSTGGAAFRFYVSRGTAAALAVDDVAHRYGDVGPLEVESVEEPSGIAGNQVMEMSYVGLEPWVVLLRNVERRRRYYTVVSPDGEIMGSMETPFLEYEGHYLQPGGFADSD